MSCLHRGAIQSESTSKTVRTNTAGCRRGRGFLAAGEGGGSGVAHRSQGLHSPGCSLRNQTGSGGKNCVHICDTPALWWAQHVDFRGRGGATSLPLLPLVLVSADGRASLGVGTGIPR